MYQSLIILGNYVFYYVFLLTIQSSELKTNFNSSKDTDAPTSDNQQ